ncbi:hypothetical protein BC829DRAFT_446499 [Chytridium lagenaria]|nr:hypothetical protein BC829DRAFT_446499 [Chytridium lagenaria]
MNIHRILYLLVLFTVYCVFSIPTSACPFANAILTTPTPTHPYARRDLTLDTMLVNPNILHKALHAREDSKPSTAQDTDLITPTILPILPESPTQTLHPRHTLNLAIIDASLSDTHDLQFRSKLSTDPINVGIQSRQLDDQMFIEAAGALTTVLDGVDGMGTVVTEVEAGVSTLRFSETDGPFQETPTSLNSYISSTLFTVTLTATDDVSLSPTLLPDLSTSSNPISQTSIPESPSTIVIDLLTSSLASETSIPTSQSTSTSKSPIQTPSHRHNKPRDRERR